MNNDRIDFRGVNFMIDCSLQEFIVDFTLKILKNKNAYAFITQNKKDIQHNRPKICLLYVYILLYGHIVTKI